jgi:hypothetical protein
MINLQNPSKRCFSTEISKLDLDILIDRQKDIEKYLEYGVCSNWMIFKEGKGIFSLKYWDYYYIIRYQRLLLMELLDRCKKFELFPKLRFFF